MENSLKGRTVVGVDVSSDEHALRFRCEGDVAVVWDTEGDCCSESWWADITELGALRGGLVREVESIDLPGYNVEDGRTRQDEDSVYGYATTTDRGRAVLAFRNSSNGYYGGWAQLGEDGERFAWREIEGSEWSA